MESQLSGPQRTFTRLYGKRYVGHEYHFMIYILVSEPGQEMRILDTKSTQLIPCSIKKYGKGYFCLQSGFRSSWIVISAQKKK